MLARALGVIIWLFVPFAGEAAEIDFGRYHALVIGNNAYRELPRLESAVGDAEAVARLLETRYGFDVRLLRDATKRDILRAVNGYRAELTERDNLLIYYAGHGWLDRQTGTGYWQPVDAEPDDDLNWIANGELTRRLNAMSARHVMVIADSCYSGTLVREAQSRLPTGTERETWLRRMAEKRSRTAIVSGGLEPVVDSGRGGHSVFANALLAALEDNTEVLEGQELFRKISRPVVVNAEQTPQYSDIRRAGHEGGEFLFVPKGSTVVVVTPGDGPTGASVNERAMELELWKAVKDSDDSSSFEAYVKQYPEGTFAEVARLRIEQLRKGDGGGAQRRTAAVIPAKPALRILEMDVVMVALGNANLRAGPSAESEKVGQLKRGAEVTVTGKVEDGDWYRIEGESGRAFVYAPLLGEEAPPEEPAGGAAEMALWEQVKRSENPDMMRAYLARFPEGLFAGVARTRIEELERPRLAAAPAVASGPPLPAAPAQSAAVVHPGPVPPGGDIGSEGLAGSWSTSFGAMTFSAAANGIVRASYPYNDGSIEGRLDGVVLSGFWVERSSSKTCANQREGSYRWGRVEFRFAAGFTAFTGKWSYCDAAVSTAWNGTKIGGGAGTASWSTSYGVMIFPDPVAGPIRATYGTDEGRIIGEAQGTELSGYWVERSSGRRCDRPVDGSYHWGRMEYHFDPGFTTFTGKWGYCDAPPLQGWSGARQ